MAPAPHIGSSCTPLALAPLFGSGSTRWLQLGTLTLAPRSDSGLVPLLRLGTFAPALHIGSSSAAWLWLRTLTSHIGSGSAHWLWLLRLALASDMVRVLQLTSIFEIDSPRLRLRGSEDWL